MPVARFGVLTIVPADGRQRYVIVDQQTGCIVDGVYARLAEALEVATLWQSQGCAPEDMTPTADALGLRFPRPQQSRR
jgi:hypothetical protein